jgi:beta-glucanase (GH16 family)
MTSAPDERTRVQPQRSEGDAESRPGPVIVVGAVLLVPLLVVAATVASRQFGTSGQHTVPAILGDTAQWTELFEDDFGGEALDPAKWQAQRGVEGGGFDPRQPFNLDLEEAWFSRDNATVADGLLHLTARPEPATVAGRDYSYSSGMVETGGRFLVEQGSYVEARIQVPRCDGCWPAFWLVPQGTWPPEIDVMEWGDTARDGRRLPHFNYITPSDVRSGPVEYGPPDRDMRGGFHTFGLLWTKDAVLPVLDGVPYPEVQAVDDLPDSALTLVLNLSVKKDARPEAGSEMLVDWVRVWGPADRGAEAAVADTEPGTAAPLAPSRLRGRTRSR